MKNREMKFLSWHQTDLSDFSSDSNFFVLARKPIFGVVSNKMVATHLRACSLKQWLNSQDLITTRNCEVLASGCVDEIIFLPPFEGILGEFSAKNRKTS